MSITKAQSQTAVKRVNIDKQFWKIKIRKFGFSTRLSLVDLVETDVKSIFSIKKRYCKSAGLEFSQFLFSGKCLYFTLSIIFAAYRILHSHFGFWFLFVFTNTSHCFGLLCVCWESMFSVTCHFPLSLTLVAWKNFPLDFCSLTMVVFLCICPASGLLGFLDLQVDLFSSSLENLCHYFFRQLFQLSV